MGAEHPQRVIWTHEEDPDGLPIALCNRGGYLFTVRPDPNMEGMWKPDVDPRLLGAFVSFKPLPSMDDAMDFCEQYGLPQGLS